jgi:hypothetical protein
VDCVDCATPCAPHPTFHREHFATVCGPARYCRVLNLARSISKHAWKGQVDRKAEDTSRMGVEVQYR